MTYIWWAGDNAEIQYILIITVKQEEQVLQSINDCNGCETRLEDKVPIGS